MMRSVWVSMISDLFNVSTWFPPPSMRPTPGYLTTESPSATDSETTQRRMEKATRFGERHVQPLATATSALGQTRSNGNRMLFSCRRRQVLHFRHYTAISAFPSFGTEAEIERIFLAPKTLARRRGGARRRRRPRANRPAPAGQAARWSVGVSRRQDRPWRAARAGAGARTWRGAWHRRLRLLHAAACIRQPCL